MPQRARARELELEMEKGTMDVKRAGKNERGTAIDGNKNNTKYINNN